MDPYPDSDWVYYVDARPYPDPPVPPPAPPAPPTAPAPAFHIDNGVSFFVSMATAMASDTTLFKLGMVTLSTSCNDFDFSLARHSSLAPANAVDTVPCCAALSPSVFPSGR